MKAVRVRRSFSVILPGALNLHTMGLCSRSTSRVLFRNVPKLATLVVGAQAAAECNVAGQAGMNRNFAIGGLGVGA